MYVCTYVRKQIEQTGTPQEYEIPNIDVSFPSVSAFIASINTPEGANDVMRAGAVVVDGKRYLIHYDPSGPKMRGEKWALTLGFLASNQKRMQAALRDAPAARQACLEAALRTWVQQAPDEQREEAAQRILACAAKGATTLSLHGFGLTALPPVIASLTQLRRLRLPGNALTSVPPEVKALEKLEVLELDGNRITALPRWITGLPALRVISANDNRIDTYPWVARKLPHLAYLWLENNAIPELPDELLRCDGKYEDFLAGNPCATAEHSRHWLGFIAPCSPTWFDPTPGDATGSWIELRRAPLGTSHGRLPHYMTGAIEPAEPDREAAPQRPDGREAARCSTLFATALARLDSARDETQCRSTPILAFRLALLERWMLADIATFEPAMATLELALDDCPSTLLAALDDLEIFVIQSHMTRVGAGASELAALGYSLYRLNLLMDILRRTHKDPAQEEVTQLRSQLAYALGLPGETRGVSLTDRGFGFHFADPLPPDANALLAAVHAAEGREREADAGLVHFITHWAPWQAYVRRTCPATIDDLNGRLQDWLSGAQERMEAGQTSEPQYQKSARHLKAAFEARVRDLGAQLWRTQFPPRPAETRPNPGSNGKLAS